MLYKDDKEIVELFVLRDENAIYEVHKKYCFGLRSRIMYRLQNEQDTEECLQDIYITLWNTVHVKRPEYLSKYIFAICRRRICDKMRYKNAKKRMASYTELTDIQDARDIFEYLNYKCTLEFLISFLQEKQELNRRIFIDKYLYGKTIGEISMEQGRTEASVKMILYRMRKRLQSELRKNEISL